MFDLLGVVAATGDAVDLPGDPFVHDDRYSVPGEAVEPGVAAVWLGLAGTAPAYARAGARHLFMVGDVFHRTDSPAYAAGARSPSAAELLESLLGDPESTLARIKGPFTLALVDAERRTCRLFASRAAMSPFYWAAAAGTFFFSTSLGALARAQPSMPDVDPVAVAELALFNYPIGSRTYLSGVSMLTPGGRVTFDGGRARRDRGWAPASLYDGDTLPARDALETGAALFHRVTNDAAADQDRLRVSFTSGFDSRAILAVLDRPREDLLCYAFGIPGSLNVAVPAEISRRLAIPFEPLYLEDAYEREFDDNALAAVVLSDGLSTVERANYPYAFRSLADFSPVVLTGLFGSELLRTFQNVGHIVSAPFLRINAAPDRAAAIASELRNPDVTRYLDPARLAGTADGVAADLDEVLGPLGDLDEGRRFYMFLLLEGLRKYFGAEVHMERPWGRNRFPFLDDEFVEFAFRAPFSGVHGRHTRPTIEERFRSQYFYAHLIERHRPELLSFTTDHGYPPGDVLSRLWALKVGSKFLVRRLKEKRTRYREFRTEEWTEGLYRRHLAGARSGWSTGALEDDLRDGTWRERRTEFAKAASLELWIERL